MKGDPKVIQCLNDVLTAELTAINQYFLHARMCKSWGYEKLGNHIYKESIDEMKHAQSLIDRILFLEGLPNVQKLGTLHIGETVEEQLKSDLQLEMVAVPRLKDGIAACQAAQDHTSRELLEHILESEESHIDWIESQLTIIKDVGIQNYLATQIS